MKKPLAMLNILPCDSTTRMRLKSIYLLFIHTFTCAFDVWHKFKDVDHCQCKKFYTVTKSQLIICLTLKVVMIKVKRFH